MAVLWELQAKRTAVGGLAYDKYMQLRSQTFQVPIFNTLQMCGNKPLLTSPLKDLYTINNYLGTFSPFWLKFLYIFQGICSPNKQQLSKKE